MPVKIQNCTKRLVSVRLNTGRTVHIQPRTFSPPLLEVEVKNSKVQKLLDQHIIALHHMEEPVQASAVSPPGQAEVTPEQE